MVAAVSTTLNPKAAGRPQNGTRPPLLPSDPENGVAHRRPKAREVTSRYMSSSSSTASSNCSNSKRCPSPVVSRTAAASPMPTPQTLRRSQSVERRRAATPRPNSLDLRTGNGAAAGGEMSAAQKLLVTSTRSLSVSFQGESYSLQVSKAKRAPSPTARKGTPERRKVSTPARPDQSENSRPMDQYRWPARLRPDTCMTKSLDCTVERKKVNGSGSNVVRALQNSLGNDLDGRLRSISCNLGSVKATESVDEAKSVRVTQSEAVASSDTDSVSSGSSNSGPHELGGGVSGAVGQAPRPRGIVVPARFMQETNNLLRRQSEYKANGARIIASPKVNELNRLSVDSPVSSPRGVVNSRGQLSPIRGSARPASPSKLSRPSVSSPSRGVSPSRVRNGVSATPSSNLSNIPSVLSFAADVRRGKTGEEQIEYAHVLRLLHNRQLQLRFVNARANAALAAQRSNAERSLYNAWITTSKLRESVRAKRTELQLLRQNLKLTSILQGQMTYLEECSLLDRDYSNSLSGAIEALRASTLRLPVVDGARADVHNVKDAISSAVDVMQAMASSICLLLSKVGEVNSLADELANVSVKEHALLGQCRDLLSTVAAMQVEECSLRTHILQQERVPSSLIAEV
ncbi:PREDICTED: QWRF motif-containing protein 2-like [Fragaria vesca subsp. vesca]|uniref:QWRF motif-containing protein 2-like n=1 Tax=Fragaria vesca subsp. vesca TaxID=101020 RepID=UPI0002C352C1|nr:PREDICTED: QWRF motif-containing protein 2-like [Fragaria vesca subsp. vesca]XP_011458852.1 PREDICTED: QWRF motif-containing protein 2-like [Fragaria vesca subsp. vesca]